MKNGTFSEFLEISAKSLKIRQLGANSNRFGIFPVNFRDFGAKKLKDSESLNEYRSFVDKVKSRI